MCTWTMLRSVRCLCQVSYITSEYNQCAHALHRDAEHSLAFLIQFEDKACYVITVTYALNE